MSGVSTSATIPSSWSGRADIPAGGYAAPGSWDNTVFAGTPGLSDDTFLGAQFLAPINSNGDIVVSGQIESNSATQNKAVDYYAVPLLAGQTINTRLDSPLGLGLLNLGVFDSQRRLIATDYSFADPTTISGQTFQFTAKLPGVYYFAVAGSVNNTFTAGATPLVGTIPYTLFVSGAGNLGIGGIAATNNILDTGSVSATGAGAAAGFHRATGDFGAAFCGGLVISNDGGLLGVGTFGFVGAYTFVVDNGNLRDVEGGSLGNGVSPAGTTTTSGVTQATAGAYGENPTGLVPNGTVGMLRATSTSNTAGQGGFGVLTWNIFDFALNTSAGQLASPLASEVAVGGDYQMVDGANFVDVELVANGNIGTVRANSMASDPPSYFQVNAANDPTKRRDYRPDRLYAIVREPSKTAVLPSLPASVGIAGIFTLDHQAQYSGTEFLAAASPKVHCSRLVNQH